MLLTGSRESNRFGPIPPEGSAGTTGTVTGIYDKGSGAVVVTESTSVSLVTDQPLFRATKPCSSGGRLLARGDNGTRELLEEILGGEEEHADWIETQLNLIGQIGENKCLLVDVIGLPWYLVHEEAGRWEHVMSDEVMARLVVILGDPAVCPHGNPIPGSARSVTPVDQVPLSTVKPGDTVRFARLTEEIELDEAALRYLDDAGFVPGVTATVSTKAPDGTLVLDLGTGTVALGPDFCDRMYVEAA